MKTESRKRTPAIKDFSHFKIVAKYGTKPLRGDDPVILGFIKKAMEMKP